MADKVQLTLEYTINDLDNLVKQGLFQRNEIKNILKKRRFYEYKFERKIVDKMDYFKAIRYEKLLHKKLLQRKKEKKIIKSSYFDFTFLRRTVFLFQKCIRKFRKDQDVWLEFFFFLIKHQCHNIINKEIGNCLSLFPNNLDFWKIAAYNEHENNYNSLTARNIFQKCLRFNNTLEAFIEYFIFELKFVEKIILRKNFLKGEEEKKELNFIDDVVEEEKKEKEIIPEVTDDVVNLVIPNVIWENSLEMLKNVSKVEICFEFLRNLYKHGNKLKIQELKNKIKNRIKEISQDDLSQKVKFIEVSLEKYSDDIEKKTKKFVEKFKSLLEANKGNKDVNLIISNCIRILEEFEFDEEKQGFLRQIVFNIFKEYIDFAKLSFNDNNSFLILSFITKNFKSLENSLKDLKKNFDELFENAFNDQLTQKSFNKEFLKFHWNYLSNTGKTNLEITTSMINKCQDKAKRNNSVVHLIEVIFDEIEINSIEKLEEVFKKMIEIYKKCTEGNFALNKDFSRILINYFFKLIGLFNLEGNLISERILQSIIKFGRESLVNMREIVKNHDYSEFPKNLLNILKNL